jgi:hypothetical protein
MGEAAVPARSAGMVELKEIRRMWVFLNDAFLSIVEDRRRPSHLLVRARKAGDIEAAFRGISTGPVVHTPDADYAYRTSVPRSAVQTMMREATERIDYDNFKNSVADDQRHDAYVECWGIMESWQRAMESA